jgi:hypothetical protein
MPSTFVGRSFKYPPPFTDAEESALEVLLRLRDEAQKPMRNNLKHEMCGTPEYVSWQCMRARCLNPKAVGYANYGGRGITICGRWDSFENFYSKEELQARGVNHEVPYSTIMEYGDDLRTLPFLGKYDMAAAKQDLSKEIEEIQKWKLEKSIERTKDRRPDLLKD